jgi:hypothetical protein
MVSGVFRALTGVVEIGLVGHFPNPEQIVFLE